MVQEENKEDDTMAKIMTASSFEDTVMNDDQRKTLVNQVEDAIRKNSSKIPKDAAQFALGVNNLGRRLYSVFEEISMASIGMVKRSVTIPDFPIEAAIRNGRDPVWTSIDGSLAIPTFPKKKVDLCYFLLRKKSTCCEEIEYIYRLLDLYPCPSGNAYDNYLNPEFSGRFSNGCLWRDLNGDFCSLHFYEPDNKSRAVFLGREESYQRFGEGTLFAGVRKK